MKKVLGFYKSFFQTLSVKSYEGFAESAFKNSGKYFLMLMLNALIITTLIMIPTFVQLPNILAGEFDKIDAFTINGTFETNTPIEFPKNNPVLIINYGNETPQPAKVIIDNNRLYAGAFFKTYTKDLTVLQNAKENSRDISAILAAIILLMLPTVAVIYYIYLLFKFAAIIIIAAVLAQIIAALFRLKVSFRQMFNCAVYAVSLTVFLDLIFFVTGFNAYFMQFLPLAVYMIAGIIINGKKIDSRKKSRYIEVKERF